jgi:DNA polymerase
LAQIEARITAALANQRELLTAFANHGDPYSDFASVIYGIRVSKGDPATKRQRFVGKTCILGLGFGMSGDKLQQTLSGGKERVDIPLEEAKRIVHLYRNTYREIPRLWKRMDACAGYMIENRGSRPVAGMPLTVEHEKILLPNGMQLNYPSLHRSPSNDTVFRKFITGGAVADAKVWGGMLTENVVQALARIILSDTELRLARHGLEAALQVHDELIYVVPDRSVEGVKRAIEKVATAPVPFLPGLPIECEIGVGQSYGGAK